MKKKYKYPVKPSRQKLKAMLQTRKKKSKKRKPEK